MLRFQRVTKRFPDGTEALSNVSLEVPRGQFCVILGPSGSGKSTLLRLVNGIHRPSSGQVLFAGTAVTPRSLRSVQRRVGMVHQQFQLAPRLPVLDNVLGGTLPAVGTWRVLGRWWPIRYQRRACELLEAVGLEEIHLYRRAADLSGGQQQRVAIARAFVLHPDVVLADEPVASLDPSTSRAILALLKTASRREGATVLCSLHQLEYAIEFADRVVGLKRGQLMFDCDPQDLSPQLLNETYGSGSAGTDESEREQPASGSSGGRPAEQLLE